VGGIHAVGAREADVVSSLAGVGVFGGGWDVDAPGLVVEEVSRVVMSQVRTAMAW